MPDCILLYIYIYIQYYIYTWLLYIFIYSTVTFGTHYPSNSTIRDIHLVTLPTLHQGILQRVHYQLHTPALTLCVLHIYTYTNIALTAILCSIYVGLAQARPQLAPTSTTQYQPRAPAPFLCVLLLHNHKGSFAIAQ